MLATTMTFLVAACGAGTQPHVNNTRTAAIAPTHARVLSPPPTRPANMSVPRRLLLRVPALSQLPQLPNGCEVTSLAMLLAAAHHPTSKLRLARLEPRDPSPAVPDDLGFDAVRRWGDPEIGFVGSVTGDGIGYAIYHRPLAHLLDRLLPQRALDLTGSSFRDIRQQLATGRPVVMWVTTTFAPTDDWVTWHAHGRLVRATSYEHAVLLVGYDRTHVYVNNPLTGLAAQRVDRASFVRAWMQLGRQALTYQAQPREHPAALTPLSVRWAGRSR